MALDDFAPRLFEQLLVAAAPLTEGRYAAR